MDEEIFFGIKKGKSKTWEKVKSENLQRSWFLCYEITQKVETAAPLLLQSWERSVRKIRESEEPPSNDFTSLLTSEMLALSQKNSYRTRNTATQHRPSLRPPIGILFGKSGSFHPSGALFTFSIPMGA